MIPVVNRQRRVKVGAPLVRRVVEAVFAADPSISFTIFRFALQMKRKPRLNTARLAKCCCATFRSARTDVGE